MIPDLARLNLNSCKPCGRGSPVRASFAVPYQDWLENKKELCLVCQDPLDGDSKDYPWKYDSGPKVIQLCSTQHVYHVGCAARTLAAQADMLLRPSCPECRLPFDDDLEARLRSALLKYDTNPYEPTAIEHWRWEEHKLLLQKEQVRSLVVNNNFLKDKRDDTQELAKRVLKFQFYNAPQLSNYLRDSYYLNPTGVANFAYSLMLVMHDDNDLDTMWELESMMSEIDKTEAIVKTAGQAMISYAKDSIRKLMENDESERLEPMLTVDFDPYQLYNMSDLGRYALANQTELTWDEAMDEYSEWMLEYWRRQYEVDSDGNDGNDGNDGDDSSSDDDPDAVPGTPPPRVTSLTLVTSSDSPRRNMVPVPETPEQPTPPPRPPGPAPVIVPESPYARRDPPPEPERRQRTGAAVPT